MSQDLSQALATARRALAILEKQAAGYTGLEIPAHLQIQLEGVMDADAFAKLQKGKQGRTLWRAAACRPYVEEGSYTTHSLEESLGWTEDAYKVFVKKLAGKVSSFSDLVAAYRDHAPAYAALVQRIAATDRIIDQIVYQLYGLTAEEIAIIEAD